MIPFVKISTSRKLENSVFFAVILLVFRIIFPDPNSLTTILINEFFVFCSGYFLVLFLFSYFQDKTIAPISVILNSGILTAILFFIMTVSSTFYDEPYDIPFYNNFLVSILFTLANFVLIFVISYIFTIFKELFYLRQKKNPGMFFNTMVVFFILSMIGAVVKKVNDSYEHIFMAFYVVSFLLIFVNTLRVAWIAFLQKKQKLQLLAVSIILSVLFSINFASSNLDSSTFAETLTAFSAGFAAFYNLVMIYGAIYFGVIFFTTLFHLPTAEVFDRKSEEISTLMDLSKLITQVFDFKDLAETVTRITQNVSYSDAAWLLIEKDESYELISVSNISIVNAENFTNSLEAEKYLEINEVKILNHTALETLESLNVENSFFQSMVIAPLKIHNKISGYLFAARKLDLHYDVDDKKNIGAFADYAALALENAKHIEESIEKERLEKELDVARDVQYKILPSATPDIDNLDITALFIPAFEVGGDYYDFFRISENELGFVVADVSGKGISAAFIMAEIKGVFESLSLTIKKPSEVLIKANDILKNSLESKTFVTAIYGIINTDKGTLNFARAGHTPLLWCSNGKIEELTPKGIGLGLIKGNNFKDSIKEMEINLKNNDILILYTDGIPESQNELMEEFGYQRFKETIVNNCAGDTTSLSNEILKNVTTFSKGNSQNDDITLVLFKWNNNNKVGDI